MKIVLTGATGYIGSSLLTRLVADGHSVTALVRSEKAAAEAGDRGAEPVIGDLYDPDWVTEQFRAADGAVHTAAPGDGTSERMDRSLAEAAVRAFSGTPKPYVHTSGIWIYGDNTDIAEDSPFQPPALTAWRSPVEQIVLDADVTASIVIPGIVHGYGRGIPAAVFGRDDEGRVRLVGDGTQHWTTVHVDDVAALYAVVLASGEALGYVIGASGDNPTVLELAEAAAGDAGVLPETGDESRARLGAPFADALLLDQATSAAKARSLGWKPAGPTLVEEFRTGSYAA
jgi:nucleoside-diphosphate-sugar epimerase